MTFKRATIFQWLIAALALVPVILYVYLGQFSRLMFDDYCSIASAREMGAWNYMVDILNNFAGGYANWFLKGAMAPLDTLLPRITPALIIVLWLAGLIWLVFQVLTYLKIDHSRRALSVSIAALAVAAAIHAFYSPQSFYWYTASTQNALPLALLTIYMALSLWTARRSGLSLLAVIAGGLLCFISAGSGEIFVAFQGALLTFCLLSVFAFLPASLRRTHLLIFGAGWLATLAGLAIQLSVPGVALRAEYIVQLSGPPNRSISVLIYETLSRTLTYMNHPPVLAGFVMLMGVGLLVMLVKYKPQPVSKAAQPVKLALPPLWIGLIFQLLWIPLLWFQTSEDPQLLGRFSIRYMMVLILNIAFILGFLLMLWQRKRIQVALQKRERGLLIIWYIISSLSIFVLIFVSTQIRSIGVDRLSAAYLFTSLLVFLVLLTWQLLCLLPSAAARRFGLLALYSSGIGWVCIAAMVFVSMYGAGYVQPRTMAAGAYLLVVPGLLWGVWIGYLLKHYPLSSQAGQSWMWLLRPASLALVLIIAVGIVQGQAAWIPNFQLYAREWDARHQEIIKLRDSGHKNIETAPLTWNLADYADITALEDLSVCAPRYYGVQSIVATDA